MARKKTSLTYDAAMLKNVLSFAGPDLKDVTQDTHDDLLSCWGICQSVFGGAAKPEHALALLPHYQTALASEKPAEEAEEEEEEEDEEGEDEDDEPNGREVIDAEHEVIPIDDDEDTSSARRRRSRRGREH